MDMRGKRIQTFYKEMYDVMNELKMSDIILNTYPDSLDERVNTYLVVELPYSLRDIDISDYDVKTSFARFSFFAKDRTYKSSRMPDIVALEKMYDRFIELFPYRGTNYSLMKARTVIPPKKADAHYHYLVVNVPIMFD